MKKLILISIISLLPTLASATTVTASVSGTLKVYQTVTASSPTSMIWPAQFAGALPANHTNTHTGAPATGIPNVAGDTQGRAGVVNVVGSGATIIAGTIATPMTLTNGANTLSAALSLHGNTAYSTAAPTAIPGTSGQLSQTAVFYVKGIIASGTAVAGSYTGTAVFTLTY